MLSLTKLFLGIFLTDFCILCILSQILNNFHNILQEKRLISDFCFSYVNSITFFTYKEISVRCIYSLQNKMHVWGCFVWSKKMCSGRYVWVHIFFLIYIFFSIIMRIHITTNKYRVNKIWKMKNKQKYANLYETESVQKHYLNYFIRTLRLGERKI